MKLPPRPRAVITGAASGLGRALALHLARRQARLVLADIDHDGARQVARQVEELGGEAMAVPCDVASLADVEAVAAAADERFGGVDLLVNNAGVAVAGRVGDIPMDDWSWIVGVNAWGVIHGCHVFVPRLRAQGRGFILNVASSAGFAALPEMAPYNVTKAAVISMSETLYAELAADGVAVSVACPTFFQTNLLSTFRSPTERHGQMARRLMGRASNMDADQVAAAALRGLEAGHLHVVPQLDGKLIALGKRLLPGAYHRVLRGVARVLRARSRS